MKQNEPVSKIMTSELKTVHVGQKLSEARHVLVLDFEADATLLAAEAAMCVDNPIGLDAGVEPHTARPSRVGTVGVLWPGVERRVAPARKTAG